MIKHLNDNYETVEYADKRYVMLYDNVETEFYPTHWHNAIEIIMPIENNFFVEADGSEFRLNEREILLIPAGVLHTLPAQPGRRIIFQCDQGILMNNQALEPVMAVLNAPLHLTPDTDRDLYLRAKKAMLDIYSDYYENSEITDVKIYLNLINMLVAIREFQLDQARETLACAKDKMVQYNEKFKQVLKYIDQNYMYDISLDTLAEIAGYSKFHFSRIFKQFNSMSYLQYINLRRTRAAETLLLDPTIPITEVAMQAGFSSLSTFNRIFKENRGMTPRDFRAMYKKNKKIV